ncbi:MAG: ElyC/SanA/YdcF family protein [Candidatus Promineifilaceae bacterium]|nr:ElyC/SanA/YdcF family protein [Candidatus Promineifilaceae bacterium]
MLVLIALLAGSFPFLWRGLVRWRYEPSIYAVNHAPEKTTAVVFGAAVRHGRLSTVLRDRMDTAIELYQRGQVGQILVSGAEYTDARSEPEAMRAYAMQRGVPQGVILSDPGGLRTYDTCYRARHLYDVESAILVTQAFHLPRALFTCNRLGISAVGTAADKRPYRAADWYEMRETAATLVALWDVVRREPPLTLEASLSLP